MQETLALGATLALVAASIFVTVGWRLQRRRVDATHRWAVELFAVWWYALAGSTAMGAALSILALRGWTDLDLFVTAAYGNVLLICIALWGLLGYLLYLFTGRRGFMTPLTVFYVLYFMLLVYYVRSSGPAGVNVGRWSARVAYERAAEGPFFTAILLLLVLPQIFASLGLLVLSFRAPGREQRVRLLAVGTTILVWFGSTLVASLAHLSSHDAWQIASRLLGITAALAVLITYWPPPPLKAWFRRGAGARERLGEVRAGDAPPPKPETGTRPR